MLGIYVARTVDSLRSITEGSRKALTQFHNIMEGPQSLIKLCDVPNVKQGYMISFENQQIAIRQIGKKVVDGVTEIKCNT